MAQFLVPVSCNYFPFKCECFHHYSSTATRLLPDSCGQEQTNTVTLAADLYLQYIKWSAFSNPGKSRFLPFRSLRQTIKASQDILPSLCSAFISEGDQMANMSWNISVIQWEAARLSSSSTHLCCCSYCKSWTLQCPYKTRAQLILVTPVSPLGSHSSCSLSSPVNLTYIAQCHKSPLHLKGFLKLNCTQRGVSLKSWL